MELLNPNMLWSSLAIAIPIALHFWHQRRAKTIRWAAFRFLSEIKLNQHRGFQFENLLLLLLRILAILLLSLFLAKPVLTNKTDTDTKTIHVFEPKKLVLNNFKFEAEQAFEKKEPVFILGKGAEEVKSIKDLKVNESVENYQRNINEIASLFPNQKIKLYLSNSKNKTRDLYIPADFEIFSIADTTGLARKYIKTESEKGVFVNNTLVNESISTLFGNAESVHEGDILVKLNTGKPELDSAISYALSTITQVYSLAFKIGKNEESYDLVFGNLAKLNDNGLWINTGNDNALGGKTEAFIDISQNTYNGTLPETILETVLNHYGIENQLPLQSNTSFNRSFAEKTNYAKVNNQWLDKLFLLLALLTIALERWLSINRNA